MYRSLSLLLLIIFTIACSKDSSHEDPIKVLTEANKAAFEVKTADFVLKYKFRQKSEHYDATVNVKIERVKRETYPFNIRMEYDDGTIAVFNGEQYRWLDPKSETITYVDKDQDPLSFVEGNWISQAIKMVAQVDNFSEKIKEMKDTMKVVATEKVDGSEAIKLFRTKFFHEYGAQLITYEYYNTTNKLQIKDSTIQIANNDTITFVYDIQKLKINAHIDKSNFQLEASGSQKVVKYEKPANMMPIKDGDSAPDFSLLDANGKTVTLQSLQGKVVVIDFWGTWCRWCVKAMPKLEALRKEYENNSKVIVMGISCQEPESANPSKFMLENNIHYNTLLNGDEVAQKFGVSGFPTLFVLSKEGKIVHSLVGYKDDMQQELSTIIKKLL
ncbi:MAG TPA: TlpA disulfide reductase family protein [Candidatus Kapabacteria bacterium]|nr:TlpA disulfide reductase family protein [Candidatus Kapabacteria bacterium]